MGLEVKSLTYIEIDIKYCGNTYGVAPCTAALTGDDKCFNTRNILSDCQDLDNFTETTKTIRFGMDNGFLPEDIECIPSLLSVSVVPAKVMPGVTIGERSTLSAKFKNHRSGDAGFDKYISDRSYNPFERGTFWGKFKARNPYTRYIQCRLIRGVVGQDLAEMEVEHFVVDSINGPGSDGIVILKGVDFMRLMEAETSQAPAASKGYLSTNITDASTSVTLNPVGIGDASYPSSGRAAIGEEIVTFSRAGDVFTLTRGQKGTEAESHDEDDLFQVILEYTSDTVAYIINDLIVNYTPLDSSYTDLPAWEDKVTEFSDVLYTSTITKPTPVVTLLNELVEQAGLIVFGDNKNQQVFFDFIRATPTGAELIDDSQIRDSSFRQVEQPKLRYSQIWFFYYRKDLFKNLNDSGNYYSGVVDVVSDNQYATESIKRIYSRWIPSGGRSIAADVAGRIKARYINAPKRFRFGLFGPQSLTLGQTVPVSNISLEDASGLTTQSNVIITGLETKPEGVTVDCEEITFEEDTTPGDRVIDIPDDINSLNLRSLHDSLYSSVDESVTTRFIIASGVTIGSLNSGAALRTGTWPSGATLELVNNGYVTGRGGTPGQGANNGAGGGPGFYAEKAITIDNLNGAFAGGGGGGGGGINYPSIYEGGHGAGFILHPGSDATITTGGSAENQTYSGNGGSRGQAGDGGNGGTGGAAGYAVLGDSLVTWTNLGTFYGIRTG
jgi:hypothetical protein